jgi:hypothetical protein
MAYEVQWRGQRSSVLGTVDGGASASIREPLRGFLWLGLALVLIPYVFWAVRLVMLTKMGVYL